MLEFASIAVVFQMETGLFVMLRSYAYVVSGLVLMVSGASGQYRQGFNCGDDRVAETDDGAVYAVDRDYTPRDGSGRLGGEASRPSRGGTDDEIGGLVGSSHTRRMMSSRLEDWDAYVFDVPEGDYLVSMHFLEATHHWKGLRQFSIEAEGQTMVEGLDVFDEAERKYTLNLRRVVQVSDGRLEIVANPEIDGAVMQGIHVEEVVDDGTAPPVPAGLRAVSSYGEVVLFWDTEYERTQLGVEIWREGLGEDAPEVRITDHPTARLIYRDQTAVAGHEYRYRMVAVDASGNVSASTPWVLAKCLTYVDSPLSFHELTIGDEDFRWLNQNRSSDVLVPATYRIDGEEWEDAEARYRGNTTRNLIKKNYKIRGNNGDPFPPGRLKINLQSEYRVPSPMREKLAYDLFGDAGAMAGTAHYINLMRNGEYVGVYDDFEQVDEYFLELRGLEGSVWKADSDEIGGDFRPKSFAAYYKDYVLEVGTYDDYQHLDDFFRMVQDTSDDEFRTEIYRYLDVDEFFDWYSSQAIVSNWDHVLHNYYLFRERESGLFHFIPWDLELGWDTRNHPIDYGTQRNQWFFILGWNRLFDRFMTMDEFRRIYAVRLAELMRNEFSAERIQGLVQADYDLIRPDIERDWIKPSWESMSMFDDDGEEMQDFIYDRVRNIKDQLANFATDPFVNLFVNEALIQNVDGIRDEAGDVEPWMEVYNFGNETMDLAGLGVSDESGSPGKWAFPAETTLAPRSHLLVWLDGEEGEGPMHTSFRAKSDAAELVLSYPDGRLLDELGLLARTVPDLATGRSPDAGDLRIAEALATPGTSNDPTRLVESMIRTDADDYYGGTTARVTIEVVNQREFVRDVDLEVDAIGAPGTIPLYRVRLHLEGGERRTEEFEKALPDATPVGTYRLVSRLLTIKGQEEVHRAETRAEVFNPRPVTLVINEIMANNDTTHSDGRDQFDDWIEIYNPGTRAVDLGGLYLSDDSENPAKWRMPAERLKAGDHLLVWCDDDQEQGFLHTTFKLDAKGEEIGLYERDLRSNVVIDRVVFDEQEDDVAFGRSPDGSENLIALPYATPERANP